MTGNKADDVKSIQESYKSIKGKFSENQFPPYFGPIPDISDAEALIMRTLYSIKGMATQVEIAAKAKLGELSTTMLDFLIEKGVLERVRNADGGQPCYRLTFAGKGCLLHLFPTLVH